MEVWREDLDTTRSARSSQHIPPRNWIFNVCSIQFLTENSRFRKLRSRSGVTAMLVARGLTRFCVAISTVVRAAASPLINEKEAKCYERGGQSKCPPRTCRAKWGPMRIAFGSPPVDTKQNFFFHQSPSHLPPYLTHSLTESLSPPFSIPFLSLLHYFSCDSDPMKPPCTDCCVCHLPSVSPCSRSVVQFFATFRIL